MLAAAWLRRRGIGRRRLKPLALAALSVPIVSSFVVAAWWFGLREPLQESGVSLLGPPEGVRLSVIAPSHASEVKIGDPLPLFDAAGWVNGNPPIEAELIDKVVVVDVWHEW